jgi:hypothetical protein
MLIVYTTHVRLLTDIQVTRRDPLRLLDFRRNGNGEKERVVTHTL